MGIKEIITGWKSIDSKEIPPHILKLLINKAYATASIKQRKSGFERHIKSGELVYRIVMPKETFLEQGGGLANGPIKYYVKKIDMKGGVQ